ncbi:MAG: undecaprenyl-diphosphate phosphatase [bacterium]
MTSSGSLFLGIVQGVTEFLPVSSSAHLVLAQHFLGVREHALLLDVMLHVGTLLATVWYFRADILLIAARFFGKTAGTDADWLASPAEARKYVLFIILATIPAAAVGVTLKDFIETLFTSPAAAGCNLFITGVLLLATLLARRDGKQTALLPVWAIFAVGIAQAAAIAPGISRSGATISAALLVGARRDDAARFSFLLSIPAILGAAALQTGDLRSSDLAPHLASIAAGTAAAFLSGLVALHVVFTAVRRSTLAVFTPYCWAVAAAALIALRFK